MDSRLTRMRRLAGLNEARQIDWPEDDDARLAREQKITKLIAAAFERVRLTIADSNWGGKDIYFDDSDRQAIVQLDEDEVPLEQLMQLQRTGLAASYVIGATREGLSVTFTVDPALDNAEIG